ncbi:mitochondrial proton/calcium exchanger protein isoform X2 [Belonocnema kinseyi]|uniref:mitochondrial proton/calcium exchanger protein isoform X2 n=1 Tax=Belonocnema kinseyi TaxID=2817044 RepID=UPI00143DDCBD|nr:mitochondrial proton/calcium exchanger protein isoform X2 [Belonocnema kinseyi]
MNPLVYTKPIIALHFGAMRRCCCRKLWYSENQRLCSLALIHTEVRNTRVGPSPNFIGTYSANVKQFRINNFHTTASWREREPSSKVEETVKSIKEEKEEKEKLASVTSKDVAKTSEKSLAEKRTLWQKVKAEMLHYYHGFRLLGLDMKVSAKLLWRILQGKELSRREHRLLVKTTGDMFRLIPFSVFIIVPFMEFLLPIVIKFFPGLLPSTFQTASDKEDKLKKALKVKIEMAKFLQKTLDEMSVQSSDHRSEKAKEFSEFFYKVRSTGSVASNEEVLKFSKLFEDEITLDSLSRQQLIALCRVIDVQTLGTTNFLRFLLRMRLRSLSADDRLIEKEGVESLTRAELQQACRARGMRAYGMPESKLREQLAQWLDLSLVKKVPPSLLLLSRALMVPEATPMSDKLKATISALPDDVVARTKGAIGEKEGKLDHRTNIEIIKLEEKRIEEEREEQKEKEQKEKEQKEKEQKESEPQPTVLATAPKSDDITHTDVKAIEQALDSIGKVKKMIVEKEELKELKEEMAEYQEDIQELNQMKAESKGEADIEDIKESKGAKRLFNKVNKMINKVDTVLSELERSEKKLKEKVEAEEKTQPKAVEEVVKIDELIAAIKKIQNVPDEHRLTRIAEVLGKIDDDRDGAIKIEDVLKVVELIGKEDIKLSKKQVNELIDLMEKEEVLEVEDQIQKALKKESKEIKEISKAEESIIDSSKSTVPATPVTKEKKFGKEEFNEDVSVREKNYTSSPSSSKLKTDVDSDPTRNPPIAPSVPPTPKKAEGSKHL